MSLIVHLMKKDAWYLRYELAIWLLLVVGQAGLVLSGVDARAAGDTLRTLRAIYSMLLVLQFVIAVIFAAQLVQSDPLTGTTAFWRTRPIPRSALLSSKLALATLVLLAVPFVVDMATFVALGMGVADSARSAGSAVFLRAVFVLPALAIAVVTPDVPRLVVLAIILAVGLLVTQWTMISVAPGYFALRSGDDTSMLPASRMVVLYVSLMICSIVAVVHQYLSLKTVRSILVIAVALVASVATMNVWRIDLFARPEQPIDRARFDPDPVALSLDPEPVGSEPIASGPVDAHVSNWRLFRHLLVSGAPPSTVSQPVGSRGTLILPGEPVLSSQLRIVQARSFRGLYRLADDWHSAILSALGPFKSSNLASTQGFETAAALVDVPDSVYRRRQGISGRYSAEVTLRAIGFETTGVITLTPGARYRRSPRSAGITGIELTQKGCVVTLREETLTDFWTVPQSWTAGQYVLVNRSRSVALFPQSAYNNFVFNAPWYNQFGTYLRIGRLRLTFVSPPSPDGGAIDAAWLAQAELVRVEPVFLGVFTKPLKVDEFILPPLR